MLKKPLELMDVCRLETTGPFYVLDPCKKASSRDVVSPYFLPGVYKVYALGYEITFEDIVALKPYQESDSQEPAVIKFLETAKQLTDKWRIIDYRSTPRYSFSSVFVFKEDNLDCLEDILKAPKFPHQKELFFSYVTSGFLGTFPQDPATIRPCFFSEIKEKVLTSYAANEYNFFVSLTHHGDGDHPVYIVRNKSNAIIGFYYTTQNAEEINANFDRTPENLVKNAKVIKP